MFDQYFSLDLQNLWGKTHTWKYFQWFVSPYNICSRFFSDRLSFRRINEVSFFQEANTAHSLWVQLSGIWTVALLALCCPWSLSVFIRSSWRGSLQFPQALISARKPQIVLTSVVLSSKDTKNYALGYSLRHS